MTKPSEIMELVEDHRGAISVKIISEELSLPMREACRLIIACQRRGLLLPVETSLFAPPNGKGLPVPFEVVKGAMTDGRYKEKVKLVKRWIKKNQMGIAVTDAEEVLGLRNQSARKVLGRMEEDGYLISRSSRYGGSAFRPTIWGPSEEFIRRREQLYEAKTGSKKSKGRGKKTLSMGGHEVDMTGWHIEGSRYVKDA